MEDLCYKEELKASNYIFIYNPSQSSDIFSQSDCKDIIIYHIDEQLSLKSIKITINPQNT